MSTRASAGDAAPAREDEPQTPDTAVEHERLLEHLVGARGILTAYADASRISVGRQRSFASRTARCSNRCASCKPDRQPETALDHQSQTQRAA